MQIKKFGILFLALVFLGAGCFGGGVDKTEKFQKPDIKDAFCGVHINYQYCKCAFHNEYCDDIGMSKSAANSHVKSEYNSWIKEKIEDFETSCILNGGAADGQECHYCGEGFHVDGPDCVENEEGDDEESEEEETEEVKLPDGPYNDDCSLKQEEFDTDWEKYSDIDDLIPFESRSWEAQQTVNAYDDMITGMIVAFEIERDIEIERQMQAELKTYKEALVQNIRVNLLKSFWRLAWITYSTIDSSRGVGGSYSTVLTEGLSIETVGAGLKVIQANIPANSAPAIDTSTLGGKAASVGANTALEVIDTLGDPVKVATEFVKSSTMASLPSADISPEEIAILKTQHIENGTLDNALAASEAKVVELQGILATIEEEITAFQTEITEWEAKEKARVAAMLEQSCKELTGQE